MILWAGAGVAAAAAAAAPAQRDHIEAAMGGVARGSWGRRGGGGTALDGQGLAAADANEFELLPPSWSDVQQRVAGAAVASACPAPALVVPHHTPIQIPLDPVRLSADAYQRPHCRSPHPQGNSSRLDGVMRAAFRWDAAIKTWPQRSV